MKIHDMRDLPDDDGIREPIGWSRVFTPRRMWLVAAAALVLIVVSSTGDEAKTRRVAVSTAQAVIEQAVSMIR